MASLFESTNIKDLQIPNRFIRSATGSGMADQHGHVTPKLTKHIIELVDGKVGLIITGHICVHPTGQTSPRQLCLYKDSQIPNLKTLVEKVHNKNGNIVAQINHGGAYADKTITQTTPFTSSVNARAPGFYEHYNGFEYLYNEMMKRTKTAAKTSTKTRHFTSR